MARMKCGAYGEEGAVLVPQGKPGCWRSTAIAGSSTPILKRDSQGWV
jgi:hypothetical protein